MKSIHTISFCFLFVQVLEINDLGLPMTENATLTWV